MLEQYGLKTDDYVSIISPNIRVKAAYCPVSILLSGLPKNSTGQLKVKKGDMVGISESNVVFRFPAVYFNRIYKKCPSFASF